MAMNFSASDIKWCCKEMKRWMTDNRFPLELCEITRRYSLPAMWPHGGPGLKLDYCPWCAKPLPDLEEKRWEILETEYGVQRSDDIYKADPKIPSEFYTEDWWVKRGL